jgi:murein DD-endopeptidase MepM/ murein hydrolase activator NlpD
LHGRNGSVQAAFGTRGIAPGAIIGTVVRRGDFIMRCGDTGISFHNHLHMGVGAGPDVNNAPPVANANVGNSLPFVFRDVEYAVGGTNGVLSKLNYYTSSTQPT